MYIPHLVIHSPINGHLDQLIESIDPKLDQFCLRPSGDLQGPPRSLGVGERAGEGCENVRYVNGF